MQVTGEEFGVISSGGGKDRYRISDIHSASGAPKVYAPMSGIICAQQDTLNSALVHLILKPDEVPAFNFYPIKYILIKGVLKSSLVSGGEIIVDPANVMLTKMKAAQDARNLSIDEAEDNPPGTTVDAVPEAALGLDIDDSTLGFSDDDSIDALFYQADSDYQFPSVSAGWNIGKFDPSAFGIEIILETIGYNPPLKLARNLVNTIEIDSLIGGESGLEVFKHWHDKGQILNFVDPSSFYGGFYNYAIGVTDSVGVVAYKTKNEIFDDILRGTSGNNFLNKSKIYIDLRNEHNEPFNYYGNYGNDFFIAYEDGVPLNAQDYLTSGWPIFTLDNGLLPAGITSNKIPIRIAFPEGDNSNPIAFLSVGYRDKSRPFKRLKGKKRFKKLTVDIGVTEDFGLVIPNHDAAGSTTPISTIFSIKILKRRQKDATVLISSGTKIEGNYAVDNLFLPLNMNIPFTETTGIRMKTFHENAYIHRFEEKDEFVADIAVAKDDFGTTFFAYSTDRRKNGLGRRKFFTFQSEAVNSTEYFFEHIQRAYPNIVYEEEVVKIAGSEHQILKTDRSKDNYLKAFEYPKVDELIAYFFSPADMSQIQTAVTANNLLTEYKIFLGISNPIVSYDDDGQEYTIYDIILRGFIDNAGMIEATEVNTTLKTIEL